MDCFTSIISKSGLRVDYYINIIMVYLCKPRFFPVFENFPQTSVFLFAYKTETV